MKVRDIMSTPIITEDEDTPIINIAKDMAGLGVGSVVITKDGKPAGIITERDLALKALLKDRRASEVKAKDIMSSPLVTIEPEEELEDVCNLIVEAGIKRLPVVENDVLIGIVSVRNILTLRPESVSRFYPEVHVLASGWTLDRLERSLSDCEVFLASKNWVEYRGRLKEVCEELQELVVHYTDDKELRDIFESFELLYPDLEVLEETEDAQVEHRKKLDRLLKKFRHTTYWRKLQSTSSFASGTFRFRDYRHGTGGKELRLPFKRTRP